MPVVWRELLLSAVALALLTLLVLLVLEYGSRVMVAMEDGLWMGVGMWVVLWCGLGRWVPRGFVEKIVASSVTWAVAKLVLVFRLVLWGC